MADMKSMSFRELAPGIYERDIPKDVKITMEDAKRLAALTNSQALIDMLFEVARWDEERDKPKKRKKRFLGLIPR